MLREPDLTPLPKSLDWTTPHVAKGEKFFGLLAGKVRKFLCHPLKNGQTKPCLKYATSGELPCFCEQRVTNTRPIVYVPIFTRDNEQLVIRMSAVAGYEVEKHEPGTLLHFERADKDKQPVKAKKVTGEAVLQAWVTRNKKNCNADITEYLCHLWQLHALTRWCGFKAYRSLAAASTVDLSEPDYVPRLTHVEKLASEKPANTEAA